jgi:hypothetical protein
VVATFLNELSEVGGRVAWGTVGLNGWAWRTRPSSMLCGDRCGLTRAPSESVPANGPALVAAARRLDRGWATVWAAHARHGYSGGAEGLR